MELNELVAIAKDCKGSGNWTPASLIRVGGILAGKINGIQNMSGPEKLKLIQRVLLQVLAETENKEVAEKGLSEDDIKKIHDRYDVLENVVSDTLPASLELAIQAARGGLDLKKIKPSQWVKFCSCFATTVVHQLASLNMISEAHATQVRQLLVKVEEKAAEKAQELDAKIEEAQQTKEKVEPASVEDVKPTVEVTARPEAERSAPSPSGAVVTPVVVSQETSP